MPRPAGDSAGTGPLAGVQTEPMAKKMLIDATHAEETRVVVVDGTHTHTHVHTQSSVYTQDVNSFSSFSVSNQESIYILFLHLFFYLYLYFFFVYSLLCFPRLVSTFLHDLRIFA